MGSDLFFRSDELFFIAIFDAHCAMLLFAGRDLRIVRKLLFKYLFPYCFGGGRRLSDACAAFMSRAFVKVLLCFWSLEMHFFAFAGFLLTVHRRDSRCVLCHSMIRIGSDYWNWFFIIKFSWDEFVYILRWACNEKSKLVKCFDSGNCVCFEGAAGIRSGGILVVSLKTVSGSG